MNISEHMSKEVVVVKSTLPIEEMKQLFHKKRISGAPVVDDQEKLIGVVSLSDLSRSRPANKANDVGFYANPSWGTVNLPQDWEQADTVADIMTNLVIFADQDDNLERAADLMINHGIHRVIVTSEDKVVGVLSSFDLVKEFRRQMKASKQLR